MYKKKLKANKSNQHQAEKRSLSIHKGKHREVWSLVSPRQRVSSCPHRTIKSSQERKLHDQITVWSLTAQIILCRGSRHKTGDTMTPAHSLHMEKTTTSERNYKDFQGFRGGRRRKSLVWSEIISSENQTQLVEIFIYSIWDYCSCSFNMELCSRWIIENMF